MITLAVADMKDFTRKLFIQKVFDQFYLLEGEVVTFADFRIEGELNEAYYTNDEKEILGGRRFCLWSEIKPMAFQMIKGKKLPVRFKFVLQLSDSSTNWLLEKYHLEKLRETLSGLYLNIIYQDQKLACITGMSYKTFVMDKTLERLWDEMAEQYLKQNHIIAQKQ